MRANDIDYKKQFASANFFLLTEQRSQRKKTQQIILNI